jgi:hypothetical protein
MPGWTGATGPTAGWVQIGNITPGRTNSRRSRRASRTCRVSRTCRSHGSIRTHDVARTVRDGGEQDWRTNQERGRQCNSLLERDRELTCAAIPTRRGHARSIGWFAIAFSRLAMASSERRQHPVLLEREHCTLAACYRSLYAPRTGGACDSHHRTAEIAGCTRRRCGGVAARGARAASGVACSKRSRRSAAPF